VKVGDLVRYINEDPSYRWSLWIATVVEKVIKDSPYGVSTEYVRVIWQQDTDVTGLIRASLMEVVNESR
tara:strand:- start:311 stop:517 length:207 start_codon:yes stop_codon:yes gene_type:complete